MKKLPVGIQSFEKIREGEYLYVDKTEQLWNLTQGGSYYFLSRPRRFGKSLMVNTLASLFKGERHLFQGLWVEGRWDWEANHPVVQIGFSSMGYKTVGLDVALYRTLEEQASAFGITLKTEGYDRQFRELIEKLFEAQGPVVILIDEYDKPIIDYLEDTKTAGEQRDILKTFYSVLKDLDDCLRFVFITGVSKFSRTSIFSELNNLTDLSMANDFATALGYTQTELEHYFHNHIEVLAKERGLSREETLLEIREWYNGYSWNGEDRVYNPFSILSLFRGMQFMNFWFATGTPTFLVKLLDRNRRYDLEDIKATESAFESYDFDNISVEALLLQTGYITIKGKPKFGLYPLGYPNREVRESMLRHLVSAVSGVTPATAATPALLMAASLEEGDTEQFIVQLKSLLASIPYDWHQRSEAYYHTVVHLALSLIGVHIQSEIHTANGRLDSVVHTGKTVYVLEFKVDCSPEEALIQVRKKGYAEPYLGKGKPVVALGINFSTKERKVVDWDIEEVGF